MSLRSFFKNSQFTLAVAIITALIYFKNKDIYIVTAYNNDKISINKKAWLDYRFASNRKTYFGGAAAGEHIPFKTKLELIPLTKEDEKAIAKYLQGRRNFTVEDRGFLIKGNRIDLFIPRRLGGRRTALRWGKRKFKVKLEKAKK